MEFSSSKKTSPLQERGGANERAIAGFRQAAGAGIVLREGGIGDWEKHTTGIGSKLMKLMGYEEGKGLGKNLQGIATPVEAQKRKGKGAIGFYGTERSEPSLKDFPVADAEEEEKSKFEEQLQQWRKKTGVKKKIKYTYKTAEEVIQEGRNKKLKSTSDNHITKTKVIDMTGPETRVLSSYHAIAGQKKILDEYEEVKKKKYEHFDVPELLHNLQIIVEKSEEAIITNAKTLEMEENRIVHLNHEREKYEVFLERQEQEVKALDEVANLVEMLETRHENKTLTLSQAAEIFKDIKTNYSKIFHTYDLAFAAPTFVTPLLKEQFSTWNPLACPTQHLEIMKEWQVLLEREGANSLQIQPPGDQPLDPYHQLVWETWAAALRSTIMGPWEPRDCGPLITVFETWLPPLIPVWIQSNILQCVVLPRITRAVHNWNPMQDTVPIHTWLHPWLPLLSDHLQAVYPVIRQKLSNALVHWHPSDRSAKMVLQPWKGVFSEVSMTTLIQTSIQTKLESAILEMPISPHSQKLDAWHWFLDWEDLLPPMTTIDILERCFFPKWYQSLGSWLSANPPYTEVISWYKGWRDLIPSKVVNSLQIRRKFQQALEICQRALTFQPGAAEQFGLLLSGFDKLSDPPPPPPAGSPPPPRQQRTKDWADIISSGRRENLSMRELVEKRSQERGIVFHPLPERSHEGRPVYRCGKLNISFNKNVIFVQTERGWMPKSLTTLLDDA